ncbi:hypothetical protein DICVIV_00972 [Dictyocaulus viviparus]|uniref:Uncharacterized protein n=1 Tax=Dictyocaulus viviparus TaxID=29172 RepID=A0A0D8Y7S9_DICVI|nr:hypothetical protein DICVIV_00972 [Dictyocaulus viviparus]
MEELNSLSFERLQYVASYCNLAKQLEDSLTLARSEITKARTLSGGTGFTSLYNINSQPLEPAIRVLYDQGTFTLLDETHVQNGEENCTMIRNRKAENTEMKTEERDLKSKIAKFRPFGVLEPLSAKKARKTIHSALQIASEMATIQCEIKHIDSKMLKLKEDLINNRELCQKLHEILHI